jgi:NAD+ kinase
VLRAQRARSAATNTVGLIANISRENALATARQLIDWLRERDVAVRMPPAVAARLDLPSLAASDEQIAAADFIIALGGDGTLLAASRIATSGLGIASPSCLPAPILGIHCGGPGSFGFLTETTPARAREAVAAALRGDYQLDERMMVAAEVIRSGAVVAQFAALNDLVIKGALARMLKMQVTVGETFIATYAADGLIVATPTGSTAYSLAAFGPLVHPTVPLIILTPICPHTLNVRSLIVGAEERARVVIETDPRAAAVLTVDGQSVFELSPGDTVLFHRAAVCTRLMLFDGDNFYQKLQKRWRLGERFGNDVTDACAAYDP